MVIAPGTRYGSYEITAAIGAGAMGKVYRARDAALERDVAIKILAEPLMTNDERIARFDREAKILAALNHANIAHVYGLLEIDAAHAIVMELIEGSTLAELICDGPIAPTQALEIASQIAGALDAAHTLGIVHRDLKPTNIMLSADGTVKVLDFGIAKTVDTPVMLDSDRQTPAVATQSGAVLGTVTYMSPEQARGKPVDKRADIWAFGCVLYEMLTGQPAFGGEDSATTLARVLEREANMSLLPKAVSSSVRDAIAFCLRKDVRKRVRDIGDVQLMLEGELAASQFHKQETGGIWTRGIPVAGGAFAAGVLLTAAWLWQAPTRAPERAEGAEVRFEITTPPVTDWASLAFSPDGSSIAFEGSADGQSRLWVHSLQSLSDRPLPGTESASLPFWSTDGRSIGFFSDGKLKRVDLDTGSVRTLADAPIGRGGDWGNDGTIIFAPGTNDPLLRVNELGGEASVVTTLEATQAGHRFPQFLPDGKHFLYYVTGSPESRGVAISDLEATETRRLFDADTAAVMTSSGHLFYERQGMLYVRNFDIVERELRGTAFAVPENVGADGAINRLALTASDVGSIAYRAASQGGNRQFSWYDRSGNVIRSVGEATDDVLSPALSPDGRYTAFSRTVNGNQDIWLLDLASGATTRFTFDPGLDFGPLWSPDGTRIVFSSNRSGVFDLYEKPATGAGSEELLLATAENKFAADWSADGRSLLYSSNARDTSYDIWTLTLGSGQAQPQPMVRTSFEERDGQVSPDGQWIAYQSNESGQLEVYVQPFPGPGGRWQVSTEGGAQVRWRGDGEELYYLALDGRLMAAPIRVVPGPAIETGQPVELFTPLLGRGVQTSNRQQYMVSRDGEQFLMNALLEEATRAPVRAILNWRETP